MRIICPQCRNALEIVPDEPGDDLQCPSCGSQIDFLDLPISGARREETIGKRFLLLEHLGQGAMGDVWKAKDTRLDRVVAMKLPRAQYSGNTVLKNFLREARAAARLRHENIVTVHEVGVEGDVPYIVSDFIEGQTLAAHIRDQRPDPRQAAQWCAVIARALHHAHEAGVVHRDIKPSNIMIDPGGSLHVMDFGLAKRDAVEITMTATGRILGTPAYMPPEQARGDNEAVDPRSDVYSLGVVFYELLTGKLPFRSDVQTLIHDILNTEPLTPTTVDHRIPRDLETICLRAIAKVPEKRFLTADEFADDLDRFLRGEPIKSRRAGIGERAGRWLRRNRMLAAALGIFAALTITVAILLIPYFSPDRRSSLPGPPLEELLRVILDSEPTGATVVFVPVRESDNLPESEKKIAAGQSPVAVELPPGRYLVVASLPADSLHEVYRTVPRTGDELPPTEYNHRKWTRGTDGVIRLPTVKILPTADVVSDMALIKGGEFDMGLGQPPGRGSHSVTLADYYLDQTEVRFEQYRNVFGDLPTQLENEASPRDDLEPIRSVNVDQALHYAELVGKRLMTNAEYEFAATNRGTTRYPWGNEPQFNLRDWPLGIVRTPAYDESRPTTSDKTIYNLFSNVAEWTDTLAPPPPMRMPNGASVSRMVCGAPMFVVDPSTRPADDERLRQMDEQLNTPRWEFAIDEDRQYPGLGFRCARSPRPRFADE